MPRDPKANPPAPLTRPAPRGAQQQPPAALPPEVQAGIAKRDQQPGQVPAQAEKPTPYGGSVRMAFVFLAPDVQERIEEAAELDDEKVGNWMSRVLDEAARARIEFEREEQPREQPADDDENAGR